MKRSCNSIQIEEKDGDWVDGEHPLLLSVSGPGPESTGHDDGRAEGRAADAVAEGQYTYSLLSSLPSCRAGRVREHLEHSPHQHDQPTHSLPYFQTAAVVSNGAGMFAPKQTQKRIKWSTDHFCEHRPLLSFETSVKRERNLSF